MSIKRILVGLLVGLAIIAIVAIIVLPETSDARRNISKVPYLIKKGVLRCVPESGLALQCGGSASEKCCNGLSSINNNFWLHDNGECSEVYGICGSVLCTKKCGDGTCEGKENKCNCPADCT